MTPDSILAALRHNGKLSDLPLKTCGLTQKSLVAIKWLLLRHHVIYYDITKHQGQLIIIIIIKRIYTRRLKAEVTRRRSFNQSNKCVLSCTLNCS